MQSIIRIKNLNFAYNHQLILDNINFEVPERDFVGIIGPNGSGKTTLLRLLLGFLKPDNGSIQILGLPPEKARSRIGYVPQYSEMSKDFPISVQEVVSMGVFSEKLFQFRFKNEARQQVTEAMQAVDILDLAQKPFGALSGGQRQRCLIARALASQPELLVLDEPTASVDASIEEDIYELLQSLNTRMTILLVSHDLGFISTYVKRIACINRQLVCHDIHEVSSDTVIREAYSSKMAMIRHECKL